MKYKYINEIIRLNYKCNWNCKFCNVLKVNNYWLDDISDIRVINRIFSCYKKYSLIDRKEIILSFSWGEPLLNKNIEKYIKLSKKLWFSRIQIQTNGTLLYKKLSLIEELVDFWLNEVFLSLHSNDDFINDSMWCNFKFDDFVNWFKFINNKNINFKLYINIVINKINLYNIKKFISFLFELWVINYIWWRLSFAFVQLNWHAIKNKNDLILKYNDLEVKEISNIIYYCNRNNIDLDFHYTSPPICILNYTKYNLEYNKLKELEQDKKSWQINTSNLESYKILWKEKQKFPECKKCKYNNYCLWFYKNWISFVWEEYAKGKVNSFLKN